jgi:membrane protease YdiL (CAAX protease family)
MKCWGIGATLGFAFIAFLFGQLVGIGAVMAAMGASVVGASYDGAAVAVSVLVGTPVQVVTLALAVRLTGEEVLSYLALDVPRRVDVIIAVTGLAALIVAANLLTIAMGRELVPPFQLEVHRSALAEGAVLSLWIAIIVAAPIGEEVLFRGFLFRGFVREPGSALPAILAISLIWALLHVQYDWFGAAMVFAIGLYLGYIRFLSGSTTLVILLHMLLNLESVAETVIVLGWV